MSTVPGAPEQIGPPDSGSPTPVAPQEKSSKGKVIAIVGAVVALLVAAAIGRASAVQDPVQAAAPAPVTVTAEPVTVTATVTATPAPVTVTADPTTVTAPASTVVQTQTATVTTAAPPARKPRSRTASRWWVSMSSPARTDPTIRIATSPGSPARAANSTTSSPTATARPW